MEVFGHEKTCKYTGMAMVHEHSHRHILERVDSISRLGESLCFVYLILDGVIKFYYWNKIEWMYLIWLGVNMHGKINGY